MNKHAPQPEASLNRRRLVSALRSLRRGDFSVRLDEDDVGEDSEIAVLFNEVVGAVVELVLPASDAAGVHTKLPAEARMGPENFAVRSILPVDDDDMVRTIVEEQLCDMGLQVCALSGGADAIAKLTAAPDDFDLLLTDFAMPGMNGAETIGQAALIKPSLRCLLLTGFADAETLASLPPHIEVIPKPIDYQKLALAFV